MSASNWQGRLQHLHTIFLRNMVNIDRPAGKGHRAEAQKIGEGPERELPRAPMTIRRRIPVTPQQRDAHGVPTRPGAKFLRGQAGILLGTRRPRRRQREFNAGHARVEAPEIRQPQRPRLGVILQPVARNKRSWPQSMLLSTRWL